MSDYLQASTHEDTVANQLVFDTDGYYVIGDDEWQDITFITRIRYNGGAIGIAPRIYDTNMYMALILSNFIDEETSETAGLLDVYTQVTYERFYIDSRKVAPLVVGQEYLFRTEIRATNYRVYLDGVIILNIEYPDMSRGQVGIYATAGNTCSSVEVSANFAEGWLTNITGVPGAIASIRELENEDKYLYLSNPTSTPLYGYQNFPVSSTPHTLSFNAEGVGKAQILENGTEAIMHEYSFNNATWGRLSFPVPIAGGSVNATVRFVAINQFCKINDVQLEPKDFETSYIHNDSSNGTKQRSASLITYPAKDNIQEKAGTVSTWVKPTISYTGTTLKPVLFEYGTETNAIRLSWSNGKFVFQYGTEVLEYTGDFAKDTWYNVVGRWSETEILLTVNKETVSETGTYSFATSEELIRIGNSSSSNYSLFNGVMDETIVFSESIKEESLVELYDTEEGVPNSHAMVLRATFNNAIGSFNKSIIEATLAPDYGSPILMEKADGTPMRKVSFFNFFTGEYQTYNTEMILYDATFDYLELSYQDKDIDQESFKISVVDEDDVVYGQPYQMKGRKLYLTLTEDEKANLDEEKLFVTYQLENSYTVDFNIGVPDSFRVSVGKHDGQPVKMTYEGNDFTNQKLATMVELNPLINPNHEGFLYVTRNVEKVSSFRVRITPEDLAANGGSEALVVVEPLDFNGNYISHCELNVTCEKGFIIPAYDEESIKLRNRAGRFLYHYKSPVIKMSDALAIEVIENINIIDKETGIGVQMPITLTALQEKSYQVKQGDTLESIALENGTIVKEIAHFNEKSVEELKQQIPQMVGSSIIIPIIYDNREAEEKPEEVRQRVMQGYLANLAANYIGSPVSELPLELRDVLDFNGDGFIDIRDITWINEKKYTKELEDAYRSAVSSEEE